MPKIPELIDAAKNDGMKALALTDDCNLYGAIEFYQKCSDMTKRWEAVGVDLFPIIREDGLSNLRENVQELGNLLWNIVYNQRPLAQCLTILGIDFTDTKSLFDSSRVNLNNV